MNDRITKIVIDTLGKEDVVNSRAFGDWALSDEELEKFAQLIVQECIDKTFDSEKGIGTTRWKTEVMAELKEHFGVKE